MPWVMLRVNCYGSDHFYASLKVVLCPYTVITTQIANNPGFLACLAPCLMIVNELLGFFSLDIISKLGLAIWTCSPAYPLLNQFQSLSLIETK